MRTAIYECQRCGELVRVETENEPKDMESEYSHLCSPPRSAFGIGKLVGWDEGNMVAINTGNACSVTYTVRSTPDTLTKIRGGSRGG